MITAVENRFGRINMLSEPIEWLTDNGSCFIARDTASLLCDIGMEPCTTPVRSLQARLRRGESHPGCRNRHGATAVLVRTLQ